MKNKQKIFTLTVITVLLVSTFSVIATSQAQLLYLCDGVDFSNRNQAKPLVKPYPEAGDTAGIAQEFTGDGRLLKQINLQVGEYGNWAAGQATATINVYLDNETYSGSPKGAALATSINSLDPYTFSDYLTPSPQIWYFDGTFTLENNTKYCFTLTVTGAIDANKHIRVDYDDTGASTDHDCKDYVVAFGGWYEFDEDATYVFYVFTEAQPVPTATPTPTPTNDYKYDENTNSWTWWNGTHWIPSSGPSPTANAQIVTFTGNMITYIVPLCLLLLPAIVGAWALGRAGAAKWGFIAGLNIGAIMCYLYLPSFGLWAVIAIVMVDVVMIFASQRGD